MKSIEQKALEIIKESEVTIIGSVDNDGFPNIKAFLKPREHDGLKCFYFSTNTSSMRVKQFLSNPKASLYFSINSRFFGLMLKGNIEVITDQEIKNRIWRDGDTIFYPLGKTDPDYCVLCFKSLNARLYENLNSTEINIKS